MTGASTVDGYPRLRDGAARIAAAAQACEPVLRLLDGNEANAARLQPALQLPGLLDGKEQGAGLP